VADNPPDGAAPPSSCGGGGGGGRRRRGRRRAIDGVDRQPTRSVAAARADATASRFAQIRIGSDFSYLVSFLFDICWLHHIASALYSIFGES